MKITFYFVRHGQTLFNVKGRMQGVCDSPLSDNGVNQAFKAKEALQDIKFDRVFISPSGRCKQTANIILSDRDNNYEVIEDLKEFNFGKFEGSRSTSHMDEIRTCFSNSDFTSVNGENKEMAYMRINHAMRQIRQSCKDKDKVLIVSHGFYERLLMNHLMGFDSKQYDEECAKNGKEAFPNCGIMVFEYDCPQYKLITKPTKPEEFTYEEEKKHLHFYYVRHGETLFNVYSRMQGFIDSPLTNNGIQQAHNTKEALKDIHFDAIYTSPLNRALYTANIIASYQNVKPIECDGLKEVFVGDFEGVVTNGWQKEIHDHHYTGWQDVGGESVEDVKYRILTTLDDIVKNSKDGDNILLVSHGNYYCNVLRTLFNIDRDELFENARKEGRQAMPNGGVCRFDYHEDHYELVHLMKEVKESQ